MPFVVGVAVGLLVGLAVAGTERLRRLLGRHGAAKQDLSELTRDELYERARAAGVVGRSGMNKDQLIAALEAS
jgi:hypothetical protein